MRTKRFRLLTILLIAVMMIALSISVMAAKSNAVTKGGLTAQLFTDKDSYKAGETIQASVQVDNCTGREVFVFAQINVPESIKLAGDTNAFDTTLPDGESWNTASGGMTQISGSIPSAASSSTQTGDNMQAGFWVVLTILAVCGIVALFVYGKNKKTWLSIMLCMAMVAGMVVTAVPAQAADMNGDIYLDCTVQVDGKDAEITATVSYVIYDEAEEAAEESAAKPTEAPTEAPAEPTKTPEATKAPAEPTETPIETEAPATEAPAEPTETPTWEDYYNSSVNPDDGVTTRLEAILGLVDTALTYGRNIEGSYYPNLFVDGINVNTKEPTTWLMNNQTYVMSNFYSQQNFMKILDGLTVLSSDPTYREIAYDQYRFRFDNLTDENGLLYAGAHVLVDVKTGKIHKENHEIKDYQLPWNLMWAADPEGTEKFIEAYWNAHVYDFTCLNFDRHGYFNTEMGELWNTEYLNDDPYVICESNACPFACASNDLMDAAYFLSEMTGDEAPKVWADRLLDKFIAIQDDNTGLVGSQLGTANDAQGGDRVMSTFKNTQYANYRETQWVNRDTVKSTAGYAPQALLPHYEATGNDKIFNYVANNMLGVANEVYLQESHAFDTPMFSDGADLGGFVHVNTGYYGSTGSTVPETESTFELVLQSAIDVYAAAEDKESVEAIWTMAQSWAENRGLGYIGSDLGADDVAVNLDTTNANAHNALAAVTLYKHTGNQQFYDLACKIADNIVAYYYRNGLFAAEGVANVKFDTEEAYAVFVVEAMVQGKLDQIVDIQLCHSSSDLTYDGAGRSGESAVFGYQKVPVDTVIVNRDEVSLNILPGQDNLFDDVVSHEAEAQIRQLASIGLLECKEDGKFYPNEKITRYEFVKLIVELCGFDDTTKPLTMYSDVADTDPYYVYVAAAKNAGILLSGLGTTNFNGDKLITKEEMATILARALKKVNSGETYYVADSLYRFSDADQVSGWARDYVDIAYNYRIVEGASEEIFDPQSAVSRAQAAVALKNLLDMIRYEDIVTLTASLEPYNADDDVVTWTSSNPNVADVDEFGNLYAISVGEAIITAFADGKYDTVKVTVKEVEDWMIKEISMDGVKYDLFEPNTTAYTVNLLMGTQQAPVITAESYDGSAVVINYPDSLPGCVEFYLEGKEDHKYTIYFDPCMIDFVINEDFNDFTSGTLLDDTDTVKYNWSTDPSSYYRKLAKIVDKPGAASGEKCIQLDWYETTGKYYEGNFFFNFHSMNIQAGTGYEGDDVFVIDFDMKVPSNMTGSRMFLTSQNTSAANRIVRLNFNTDNMFVNGTGQTVAKFNSEDGFVNYKIVVDKKTLKADYYVAGSIVLEDVAPDATTPTAISQLVFNVPQYAKYNGESWYIDNLRIYSIAPDALEESFTKERKDVEDWMLKEINVGEAKLEGFDENTMSYTVELPYGTTAVPEITAESYSGKTVVVNDASTIPGETTVYVEGYEANKYTIKFEVEPYEDWMLKEITIGEAKLVEFDKSTTEYTVELAKGTQAAPTITAVSYSGKTVVVNNASTIPGATTLYVEGCEANKYTIKFEVEPYEDWMLKEITIDEAKLEGFDENTMSYTVELLYGTTAVPKITAESYSGKTVVVNDASTIPGETMVYVEGYEANKYTIKFVYEALKIDYVINEDYNDMEIGTKLVDTKTDKFTWDINTDYQNLTTIVAKPGAADSNDKCIKIDHYNPNFDGATMKEGNITIYFPNMNYQTGDASLDNDLVVFDFDMQVTDQMDGVRITVGDTKASAYKPVARLQYSTNSKYTITDEDYMYVYNDTNKKVHYSNVSDGFKNYKIVVDKKTLKADYYYDGNLVYEDVSVADSAASGIARLNFNVPQYARFKNNQLNFDQSWYIDNLRIYSIAPDALEKSFTSDK